MQHGSKRRGPYVEKVPAVQGRLPFDMILAYEKGFREGHIAGFKAGQAAAEEATQERKEERSPCNRSS